MCYINLNIKQVQENCKTDHTIYNLITVEKSQYLGSFEHITYQNQ